MARSIVGGKPEKLLFAQDAQTPAVAHTGNRLAYAQVNFPTSIWQLELTSPTKPAGPATKIISSSRGDWNPQVSPDGKHIAFESRRSGNPEIWVCDRDGSNPVQVSSFGGPHDRGRHALVAGQPPHRLRLARFRQCRALHRECRRRAYKTDFPRERQMLLAPFWSADGRWIYFSTQRPDAIWKVPAEGGTAVRLTKEGRYDPQESADGTRLFYVVGDKGQSQRNLV